MITKEQIKKALYKQKPKATRTSFNESYVFYGSSVEIEGKDTPITFIIPMNEALFEPEENAQLLIRWLAWS